MRDTMRIHTRRYNTIDEIAVGDCIIMTSDAIRPSAFSTTIIESIKDGVATLVRPYCIATRIADQDDLGTVWSSAERYRVELDRLFDSFEVFVTGDSGRKDNRKR